MDLVKKLKNKDFNLKDWYMNSISLPSHKSDLPLGPYFNFIKKKIYKIKGDLIEFGVFRGDSIISTALLLKRLGIKKKIYGFDTFEGFLKKKHKNDNPKIFQNLFKNKQINNFHFEWIKLREVALKSGFIQNHSWKNTSYNMVKNRIKKFKLEKDIILVKGDISKTLNNFKSKSIAGVFMDCNLYEPHKKALSFSWKYLSKNGQIFLDDYFSLKYPGARIAINEFCKEQKIKVNKVNNYPGDFPRYFLKK